MAKLRTPAKKKALSTVIPATTRHETLIGMSLWLGSNRNRAPVANATIPPRPRMPKPWPNDSATIRPMPNTSRARPARLTGSTDSAVSATIRLMPPTTPGATAPGLQNSKIIP
jgi:hypothetical protein